MITTIAAICIGCWPSPPSPPGMVNVLYTMYIPLNHVRKTEAVVFDDFFGGDNRSDYTGSGSYRIQQELVIDTNTGQVASIGRSGTTSEYDNPDNLDSSGSCFRKFCPNCSSYSAPFFQQIVHQGKCIKGSPKASGLANNMASVSASILSTTQYSITVRFQGDPGNDLQFGAPGITWRHDLTISWDGSEPTWQLAMNNDGFPSHQIRFNGSVRRATHPVCDTATPTGYANLCVSKTPLSLFPPLDLTYQWDGDL